MIKFNNISDITPEVSKRKPIRIAYLNLLIANIERVFNEFRTGTGFDPTKDLSLVSYFEDLKFIAQHNYQVLSLQHFLQTKVNAGITLDIGSWIDEVFIFDESELEDDPYLFDETESSDETFLYQDVEYITQQTDAVINVTGTFTDAEKVILTSTISRWVDYYIPYGKKYIINYI